MRRFILAIIAIWLYCSANAQITNIKDLISMADKVNWEQINDALIQRDWEYYQSSKGDGETYDITTFSFHKNSWTDKATAWVYLFSHEGRTEKIAYSFTNAETYKKIKSTLSTAGFKYIRTDIGDDNVTTNYKSKKYLLAIKVVKQARDESYPDDASITEYFFILTTLKGFFDEGNGIKINRYSDGSLMSEVSLTDGKRNGECTYYGPDGNIISQCNYKMDKKHGKCKNYDEVGLIGEELTYVDGVLHGPYKGYKNGRLVITGQFKNDKKDGKTLEYDDAENIVAVYYYNNGEVNGTFVRYVYGEDNRVFRKIEGTYASGAEVGKWSYYELSNDTFYEYRYETYNEGILNGPAKIQSGDSLIIGTYKNGQLHGEVEIYEDLNLKYFDRPSIKMTSCILRIKGTYYYGEREGNWTYFDWNRRVIQEGGYWKGLAEGTWKINLLDENKFQTVNYRNGKLDGPAEERDSLGRLTLKGAYRNGSRSGEWLEVSFLEILDNWVPYIERGTYYNGMRSGVWTGSLEDRLIYKANYLNDEPHGPLNYYKDKKIYESKEYALGKLSRVNIYGNPQGELSSSFTILKETCYELLANKVDYVDSGRIESEIKILIDSCLGDELSLFENLYIRKYESDSVIIHGKYYYYDVSGQIIESGSYKSGRKVGLWYYYYNDVGIMKVVDYSMLNTPPQYLSTSTQEPYSGRVKLKEPAKKIVSELKIKNGLLHGKVKYYNLSGNLIKVKKYKHGIEVE